MSMPLDFKEEVSVTPNKSHELNRHNQNLSNLLREQMFYQNQDNDYMVEKIQAVIEQEIERAAKRKIIL